jgi:dTDP-glucose 4,6-dehydratase
VTAFAPKSLLVTGGAGFIGSTFVRQQVAQGRDVIVLDALTYAGHRANLDGVGGGSASGAAGQGKCNLVVENICAGAKVLELLRGQKIEAIVNFAAESHVDRSIDSPSAFIETNIRGTYSLLQAAFEYWNALTDKTSFRFVQISTDEVYGSLGASGKFSETTAYAPNSPYSASKASADMLVRAWHHTYGLPTLTTNCSNNYGPRQFPEKLIPHMIDCATTGRPLPVYGDGGNIRDWIHVEDHSAGVGLALEKGMLGGTYCFGGNAEKNNLDVVKGICNELDTLKPRADGKPHDSAIQFVKDRPGHDRRYAIDDSLATRELGFKRKYGFTEGLAQTVRWYLDNTAWRDSVLAKTGQINRQGTIK